MLESYRDLTDEQLIAALKNSGDPDGKIMDYILDKYKPLVRKKANAVFLIGGETDDLIQEGMIGLFKAIRDYDDTKETSFFHFAELCITRQLYKAVEASNRKKHAPLNSYVSFYSENSENGYPLAETLTGKSITPAAANTFTDTNNAYVLKAYAAGITTGTSATTFSPNATLNRQQMATFLRRTLQYVEKNSGYSYTSYTSKLASYTDNALVQSWAKEAMAFMNALDLVKGTTATTLNPNGTCTIEQAVIVAERSVYAHQIGWYQAAPVSNVYSYNDSTGEVEREDGEYTSFDSTNASLHPGDLVWITGKLTGVSNLLATAPGTTVDQCVYSAYLPGINPYTGQIMYLHYRDLIPVRG